MANAFPRKKVISCAISAKFPRNISPNCTKLAHELCKSRLDELICLCMHHNYAKLNNFDAACCEPCSAPHTRKNLALAQYIFKLPAFLNKIYTSDREAGSADAPKMKTARQAPHGVPERKKMRFRGTANFAFQINAVRMRKFRAGGPCFVNPSAARR